MRFLIDASMPRRTAELIRSRGHDATDVRDIGMGSAPDDAIAKHAKTHQLCLITRDNDFGNVLDYPPQDYAGLVVIQAPKRAGRSIVLAMVDALMQQAPLMERLPGRLAIVGPGRVRLRPT